MFRVIDSQVQFYFPKFSLKLANICEITDIEMVLILVNNKLWESFKLWFFLNFLLDAASLVTKLNVHLNGNTIERWPLRKSWILGWKFQQQITMFYVQSVSWFATWLNTDSTIWTNFEKLVKWAQQLHKAWDILL